MAELLSSDQSYPPLKKYPSKWGIAGCILLLVICIARAWFHD